MRIFSELDEICFCEIVTTSVTTVLLGLVVLGFVASGVLFNLWFLHLNRYTDILRIQMGTTSFLICGFYVLSWC